MDERIRRHRQAGEISMMISATTALSMALIAAVCACLAIALAWRSRRTARGLATELAKLTADNDELRRRNDHNARAETHYHTLFNSVPVAIVTSRIDGSLADINLEAMRIFGYDVREDAMKLNMRLLYVNPPERDRRVAATLANPNIKPGEYRLRHRDGSTFPALVQLRVLRDEKGEAERIQTFITDLSEYKRLEENRQALEHEQRLSARLTSVGALAAGIAHEINTPMQFVSDSVYFLKMAVGELDVLWPELTDLVKTAGAGDSTATIKRIEQALAHIDVDQLVVDANQSAERALEGIRRVTKIIRAMREFAHPDNGEHTKVDINNALETTLTVCKNVYKEIADVETHFGSLPPVMCQYGEINQVFLNIIVNAAHAIEAQNKNGEKGLIRISTAMEDNYAVIRIQDSGTGIPESVKARIFDPFFTTKEVGKGTGQGLAIVQSVIVARHHGRITVDSEVGKGTTFILRLPIEHQGKKVNEVVNEQEA
jgi:PAS domain S-box-containing protein